MSEPAIEIEQVSKSFGRHQAVKSLDLQVPRGSIYGFIGPNGSGKTTTLRMILRIYQPDQGRIVVLGQSQGKTADDRVGYLPEERGLYKRMRVNDLLTYYARLKGLYRCRERIDWWLRRLEAQDWSRKRIDSLSKGMAQKIQFIAAVVSDPELLILDEPFSGLDPVNMEMLKDAVQYMRAQGTTIVFSTHDMDMAERMCDTVFMIFQGNKVLDGTVEQIKRRFAQRQYEVRFDPPLDLSQRPEFCQVQKRDGFTCFQLSESAGPDWNGDSQVAAQLLRLGPLNHFRSHLPSLHDIFVRIATQR